MTPPAPRTPPSAKDAHRQACRPIELFVPEIKELLKYKSFSELKLFLSEINPIDLADGLGDFEPEQQLLILKLLKPQRMMEVFEELDIPQQEYVIQHLEDQTLAPLLQDIPPETVAQLFKKLPDKMVKKMTTFMNKERVETVQDILEYPPHTVGAIMRTHFIHVPPEYTVKQALAHLHARSRVRNPEPMNYIYVTNGNRRLLGGVELQILISAPSNMKMRELMSPMSPLRITAHTDREEATDVFKRYKVLAAPVVEDGRLVGVLYADEALQVVEKESTEDIQKLAGVQALENPYFNTRIFDMVKKRAPWLSVLFLGQTLTATAMGFFEDQIARAAVLALFIPLVISSGGNSGSQAATLIVRALSLKEITFRDWWRVMERELISGLILGLILGVLGFLGIFTWGHLTPIYGPHYSLVAVSVGLALVMIVMWGSVMGSLLPIFLKKMGLDPAVASAPFVATMVDVTGLIIYFSISLLILKGTLL